MCAENNISPASRTTGPFPLVAAFVSRAIHAFFRGLYNGAAIWLGAPLPPFLWHGLVCLTVRWSRPCGAKMGVPACELNARWCKPAEGVSVTCSFRCGRRPR